MTQFTPVEVTLIGGPTAIFTVAGTSFMTDPTFDPPGEYPVPGGALVKTSAPAIAFEQLPVPDVVLLSHDEHPDNLDEAGRAVLPLAGHVFSTTAAASRLDGVTGLSPWETVTMPAADGSTLSITGVPALHGPEGCEAVTGPVTGFVIHGDTVPTIYVSGDNAATGIVRDIAERFPDIDLALLFTGAARIGLFDNAALTLTAEAAVEAARLLDGAAIVPVHAEGWAHFSESRDELREAFEDAGLSGRLHIPPVGTPLRILASTPTAHS
jgi:L-ascorbate metabolism protein UlaG (beta-lactamase superfamily)